MLGLSQIESGCKVPRLTEEKAEPLVEGGARSMLASVWRPSALLLLNLLFKKLFILMCSLFMPLSSKSGEFGVVPGDLISRGLLDAFRNFLLPDRKSKPPPSKIVFLF